MKLKTLFGLFEKHHKKVINRCGVFPAERFHHFIELERYRADRNNHGFSLLKFSAKSSSNELTLMTEVQPVLQRRARASDIIGWLDDGALGVLLPETPTEGASKLVEDIYRMAPALRSCSDCQVYHYPSNWLWDEASGFEETGIVSYDSPLNLGRSMDAGKPGNAN